MFYSYQNDCFSRSLAVIVLSFLSYFVYNVHKVRSGNHIFEMVANFWLRNYSCLFDFHDVARDGNFFYGACALHLIIPGNNDLEVSNCECKILM